MFQFLSPASAVTAVLSSASLSSHRSDNRIADARTSLLTSVRALRTDAASMASSPSSVQSACSRVRQSGALAASVLSDGATLASPRSTSTRCAVSRHHPFGFDNVCTSCADGAFESAGAAGRRAGRFP